MARKPSGGAGAKPKAPKPAKTAKAGDNSGELDKGTFLEHRRLATASLRVLEAAQTAHASVLKKAKAAGCSTKVLMKVIRAARDPDAAAMELRAELRYRKWIGLAIGTQGSIFDEDGGEDQTDDHLTDTDRTEEIIFQAGESGYKQGRLGSDRTGSNTFPPGTEANVAFDKGYLNGMAAIAAEMGPNTKKIDPKRGAGAMAAAKGEPEKVH